MWEIASADAKSVPDGIVVLGVDAEPLLGAVGVHVEPHECLSIDSSLPASLVQDINNPGIRGAHRIGVVTQVPDVALLGCFRHELEHVHQYETSDPQLVSYRMQPVLANAVARAFPGGGSGVNYQLVPHEHDAHVAASALVRRECGAVPDELLAGTHRPLFDTEPLPVDGLPLGVRAMAFAALVPQEVRAVLAERGVGLALVCEQLGVDIDRWDEVCTNPDVVTARGRPQELTPPKAVLDEAPTTERVALRQPARDVLLEGYLAAAAALGDGNHGT